MTNQSNSGSSSLSFSFIQPTKLDRTNYLVWRAQIQASIIANGLEGFINGESPCPYRFLSSYENAASRSEAPSSSRRENSDYIDWKKAEKLLQSWMLSSMIWEKLAEMFMSQSKARYMPLKMQIQTTKKGAMSVSDYFDKMKKIADNLAIGGNPLASTDFIMHLLTGLDDNYESLVTTILARLEKDNLIVEEVYSLMLSHETRVEMSKGKVQNELLHDMSANFVQKGQNYNKLNNANQRGFNGGNFTGMDNGKGGYNNMFGRGYGNFYGTATGAPRYNAPMFQGNVAYQNVNVMYPQGFPVFQGLQGQYNGAIATPFANYGVAPSAIPTAQFASTGPVVDYGVVADPAWYIDSGATNHVTKEAGIFSSYSVYHGFDKLHVGNGMGLHIKHVGCTRLNTLAATSIYLNNILHVLAITKNLLSVSKLLADNDVVVEFYKTFCFVNDKNSGIILLKGIARGGLYQVEGLVAVSHAAVSNRVQSNVFCVTSNSSSVSNVCSSPVSMISHSNVSNSIHSGEILTDHFPFVDTTTIQPLELLHADLWGPATLLSSQGYHYYLSILDDFTSHSCSSSDHSSQSSSHCSSSVCLLIQLDITKSSSSTAADLRFSQSSPDSSSQSSIQSHSKPSTSPVHHLTPPLQSSTGHPMLTRSKAAVMNHWVLRQIDINNAFLNGYLTEEVYMQQPEGFVDSSRPDYVCKLHKALYGLKQTPRAWFDRLKLVLTTQWGFTNSISDTSLFFKSTQGHLLLVLVYVDDIIITGSNPQLVQQTITNFQSVFALKDLGALNYFLGVQVLYNKSGIHLSQSKYITDLLAKVHMQDSTPCSTSMLSEVAFTKTDSEPFSNVTLYRSTIGALQYATLTRPEIAFSVNKLSQFLSSPTVNHWQACKRVLRYLKGTVDLGLQFYNHGSIQIDCFSDADWAGDRDDRRSVAGYCVYMGPNLVSWCSKKQVVVSRSSAESEYRALAMAAAEVLWIRSLLAEIGLALSSIPIIWCDNQSAAALASNPKFHSRTKHIELDVHFVREKVAAQCLKVQYISSSEQTADILTKALSYHPFLYLRDKLNLTSSVELEGGC
ncbi:retrovirus-related pol polyprotein from transposon RE1 [Citrus sinensis]|uniref:Retrovirus-related pol polyprotein from transposon RE1 n=1 Tax=Citrus sinensis TaxID=2711 RepID=A0ACB8KJX0_CITSI|nr:retrovirus-related pol polyprotein from transposon RE1 [Citrus sinensis]